MTKMRGRLSATILLAALSLAAGGCAVKAESKPVYAKEQCRRVRLVDSSTGKSIVGIEDLSLDRRKGRLFLSAYDRLAVAKAVRERAFSVPEGGIYEISYKALVETDAAEMTVAPLINREDVPGGLRPVGVSYDPDTEEIAFVNRGYQKINEKWSMTPRVQRISQDGAVYVAGEGPAPRHANNILAEGGELFVTFDHGLAGWRAKIEEALSWRKSGVVDRDGRMLFDGAAYANGLARLANGDIALAGTRERAIIILQKSARGLGLLARIPVPGGPDNVTIADDGGIVTAVHPSMLRIGLNRLFGIGRAPSRVVKVDEKTGAAEILFDDISGALFSAATVAIESAGALVLGSVTDEGLLVCKRSS